MTHAEDDTVKRYKRIAESVRAKIEKLKIKSTNKFWNLQKKQTDVILTAQRSPEGGGTGAGYQDVQDCAQIISASKAGNCGEKGMAYAWWASQHNHYQNDRIYTVTSCPHWDHMWAVMCSANLNDNDLCRLSDFGTTAVMLDGWSEDFYFPNVGKLDSIRLNVWRCQNPFQMWVRGKVNKIGQGGKTTGPKRIKIVEAVT
ncbi:MAG: hypothetical protein ACRC33_10025 [Gemmataceae bacterium]